MKGKVGKISLFDAGAIYSRHIETPTDAKSSD